MHRQKNRGGGVGGLLKIQELSFTSNTPAKFFFARNFTVEKPWAVLLRLVQAAEKNSSLPDQQTKSSLLEQQKNSCLLMLLKKKAYVSIIQEQPPMATVEQQLAWPADFLSSRVHGQLKKEQPSFLAGLEQPPREAERQQIAYIVEKAQLV